MANLKNKEFVTMIASQKENFSRWYLDVIQKAELMDYSPVRGSIVFRPDGYAIWENIQQELDRRFKETGHRNAYFPLLIPETFFMKEKDHVEGFNPELPFVTEVGGEVLEEKLAIRPTSETMFGQMYHKWIKSYRDLPLLLNQWANIVRWEKRTLPFLRTTEILWQEGHTAHENEQEARCETLQILDIYAAFSKDVLAIPVIKGKKTNAERFAGAVDTFSIEAMMKDGKALQMGTSHYLGINFAKAFSIKFSDRENTLQYCHTTSWGVSSRLIGSAIMVHGDDFGLVLPPKIAATQVIIIPIGPPKKIQPVMDVVNKFYVSLQEAGVRVKIDDRTDVSPGWKFNEYEMRGVPLRLEIGPRDLENGEAVLYSRVDRERVQLSFEGIVTQIQAQLKKIHHQMYDKALAFLNDNFYSVDKLADLEQLFEQKRGFALCGWCGSEGCEEQVKIKTGATSRNIPFAPSEEKEKCLVCEEPAKHTVVFACAY